MSPPLTPRALPIGGPAGASVKSPCVDVCRMDPAAGWCEGCLRTLDEIAAWGSLDDAGRRAVLAELALRRERLNASGAGAAAAGGPRP